MAHFFPYPCSPIAFQGDRSVGTQLLPGGEASFDGNGDRNLMLLLAVSLLCSAGQPFSHQFDMRGILLSSKDVWFRESGLFNECQGGILCLSLRDPESAVVPSRPCFFFANDICK